MSTLTLAYGRPTLADRVFARGLLMDVVLIAAGAGLTAIAAQLIIPIWPVPITGQTFAVLLVGTVLGPVRGALAMVLYAVLGIVGLPVFAGGASGSIWNSTSGGFVVGFIFAAALVGWLAQREWDHKMVRTFVSFVAGTVVMYLFGLPWLYVVLTTFPDAVLVKFFGTTNELQATFAGGIVPFLLGDVLKAIVAAAILPIAWRGVRSADKSTGRDAEA
jgi:biotin transport system substrate-specific component